MDYDLTNNTSSSSGDAYRVEEQKDDDSSSDNKHQGLGLGRSGERVGGQGNGLGGRGTEGEPLGTSDRNGVQLNSQWELKHRELERI